MLINRNRHVFCLWLLFVLPLHVAFSQTFDTRGAIAPPEVNTEFMKNVHNSVNYQTGAVNFSVRLFSLKVDNDFEIPVELSYHGSGVKDYQASGEIGIGWSLSTNYRVTRTIYNRPDEHFPKPSSTQEMYNNIGAGKYERDRYLTQFTWGLPTNGGMTLSTGQVAMDGEYDIFDYSTPTASGSFVIENVANKTIRLAENLLTKFDYVTDADGIRSFTIKEQNGNNVVAGYDPPRGGYMSEFTYVWQGKKASYSWPVVKITTPANKTVQFTYLLKNVPTNRLPSERALTISEAWTPGEGYPYTTNINDINDGTSGVSDSYLTDSIISQYGKIKIYRSTTYQFIDSVALFDFNGNLVKKAKFSRSHSLDYFFLDAVQIQGNSAVQAEKYQFEYYSRDVPRLTCDIWDNLRQPWGDEPPSAAKPYPQELASETYWDPSNTVIAQPISGLIGSGANRAIRETPDYLSLKKVTLPTGGDYSYTYESNYFYSNSGGSKKGPGIRVLMTSSFDPVSNKTMTHYYKYGDNRDGNGTIPVEVTSDYFGLDQVTLYREHSYPYPYFLPGRTRTFSNSVMADSDPFFVRYNVVSYPLVIDSTEIGTNWYYYKSNRQGIWATTRQFGPGFFHTYDLSEKPYLDKMEVYDKDGVIKMTEDYEYGMLIDEPLFGVKVKPYATFAEGYFDPSYYTTYVYGTGGTWPNGVSTDVPSIYDYAVYNIEFGVQLLTSRSVTEHAGSQSVTNTTNYIYNNYGQLIKETSVRSNAAEEWQTTYKYANDFSNLNASDKITADVIKMQQFNMVDSWLEKMNSINVTNNGVVTNRPVKSEFMTIYTGTRQPGRHYFINFPNAQNTSFNQVNAANGKINIDSKYGRSLSEVLKTDINNNIVLLKDAKETTVAYIFDYSNLYTIAEAVNADDQSIAYTSFEANGSGNWSIGSNSRAAFGLTGKKSYALSAGNISKSGLNTSMEYTVSYWSAAGSSSVSGTTGSPISGRTVSIDGISWTYYQHQVTGVASVTVSGNMYIDELRLYPKSARMSTYTYDPLIGMTSQCDARNQISYYEYDGNGRLILVRDQYRNILKKICYNYKGQPENCVVFTNDDQSGSYYSQLCQSGQTALAYPVSVPAGMFTSGIDKADANAQAQAWAQQQANQYGTCETIQVQLNYSNYTGATHYFEFYNTTTGQSWFFETYYSSGVLGYLSEGVYDIYITTTDNFSLHTYTVGCGYYTNGYGSAALYGIPINQSCSSIQISY